MERFTISYVRESEFISALSEMLHEYNTSLNQWWKTEHEDDRTLLIIEIPDEIVSYLNDKQLTFLRSFE